MNFSFIFFVAVLALFANLTLALPSSRPIKTPNPNPSPTPSPAPTPIRTPCGVPCTGRYCPIYRCYNRDSQ
ncbi:hypothetical protein RclHR1_03860005 [Rhizophagus clarus]|uniref:Uncharacterized protein n=1 Tax=Rhizophagus clarus TaxID=94130 RepID=A0A2Z6RTU1_9GLOM|nr:hypothetical protein RclHR1_03860005 [Rhizophagus clarus]GES73674.1 hypothetical protein GLOIN_2v1609392 [Rhizophagus clarus]